MESETCYTRSGERIEISKCCAKGTQGKEKIADPRLLGADVQAKYPVLFTGDQQSRMKTCQACEVQAEDMKKCSGCGFYSYCSKDCQRKDWAKHKGNCKVWSCFKIFCIMFLFSMHTKHFFLLYKNYTFCRRSKLNIVNAAFSTWEGQCIGTDC